jgi:hypothetical protein
VLLRDPLKPVVPEVAQLIAFPTGSVIVMMVLLKVERMCATPVGTFFLTFLPLPPLVALAILTHAYFFFFLFLAISFS